MDPFSRNYTGNENHCGFQLSAHISRRLMWLLICGLILLTGSGKLQADQRQLPGSSRTPIIVIDPGHGGNDTGARGPAGVMEKEVTLSLAHMIANELEKKYTVRLTRTDDYRLAIFNRTEIANNLNAALFICIHTGGSFVHNTSDVSVFYYMDPSDTGQSEYNDPVESSRGGPVPMRWDQIQKKHGNDSRKLADIMQSKIMRLPQIQNVRVQGAPLLVLKGADMPAVLIDAGYLTNPGQEKLLDDPGFLTDFARAVSVGADAFITSKHQ